MNIEWRQLSNRYHQRYLSHCYINGKILCKSRIKRETEPEQSPNSRCNQCKIELLRVKRGDREL